MIKCLNIRQGSFEFGMYGHVDTPTSMSLSPTGEYMISHSMESQNYSPSGPSVLLWDIRPFMMNEKADAAEDLHSTYRTSVGRFVGSFNGGDLYGQQRVVKGGMDIERNLIQCHWSRTTDGTEEGKYVAVGTSNPIGRKVYVWDAKKGNLVHQLGGHKGAVNDVKVVRNKRRDGEKHMVASASSDRTIILGWI